MDWFERVIVGSGPAGVAAARRMAGQGTCLIDVGDFPQQSFPHPSLQSALVGGDVEALLGRHWEMLANLIEPGCLHPKQRAAALRFVMQGVPFRVRDAAGEVIVHGAGSHAAGGMSNIWGAQLLRYTDDDLVDAGDWPYAISALEPYYADLETHIGISGQVDDMHGFLGGVIPAMPPVPMVPAAERLYANYLSCRNEKTKLRFLLGRSRLALATQATHGRFEHALGETEFFTSGQHGLYTARRTLEELKDAESITYMGRYQLLSWRESAEHVELDLRELVSGEHRTLRTHHLLLGCGTVQTARLILLHGKEQGRVLPFIDHPPTLLPLFLPGMFCSELPVRSFPVQLIATLPNNQSGNMISFYYPGGLLWSDLLPDIPLPMDASVRMIGALLGGMLVAQIWETSRPVPSNRLQLDEDGEVVIDYPVRLRCAALPYLLTALRPLGAYSLERFAVLSPPGWGFHHAGCLPMRHCPAAFETHVDGRLWNSKRVRVIDGSVLPSLPAKNHTLTLMANAARIADEVMRCGY
ncbi:MAG: GMC oxidoreductase [Methylococcus sp.]|nr:GMC oxidoreductase [Methylococcus sp.]